jgi:UDP-N-acetyl-D-glucosamine dehydrogenase
MSYFRGCQETRSDPKGSIAVIGLGYVGLPLVIEFCKAGFKVPGFDVDSEKVTLFSKGKNYIKNIDTSRPKKS